MTPKPTTTNFLIVILPAILTIFVIFVFVMPKVRENRAVDDNLNKTQVTNFEECIEAGNPAMESYPRQCRHENKTFTEIIEPNVNEDDTVSIDKDDIKDTPATNGKLKAIDCLPEQRNADVCIEIYQPVCGQMQVECIKAPCDPIKQTFSNSCKACTNPRVISYTEGECADNTDIKE
jgi:hypothetical protein